MDRRQSSGTNLPALTEPQMTALSCVFHSDGELDLGGSFTRPAARLVELGLAERSYGHWHSVTPQGRETFLRLRAQENTPQGAAARRLLDKAASEGEDA